MSIHALTNSASDMANFHIQPGKLIWWKREPYFEDYLFPKQYVELNIGFRAGNKLPPDVPPFRSNTCLTNPLQILQPPQQAAEVKSSLQVLGANVSGQQASGSVQLHHCEEPLFSLCPGHKQLVL